MNVEKFIRNEKTVAVITGAEKVLTDVQSALDLIMTAKYEVGTNLIAIEKSAVADDFFILSRGLAGEMLEKFITYQAKLAIFGDYSHYTSKPLKILFTRVIKARMCSLLLRRMRHLKG